MNDKKQPEVLTFLKVLANEDRLGIIDLLKRHDQLCAKDIGSQFYLEQSTTSHHLNMMKRVGLVITQKRGRNIIYSLEKEELKLMMKKVNSYLA